MNTETFLGTSHLAGAVVVWFLADVEGHTTLLRPVIAKRIRRNKLYPARGRASPTVE
jgi:hypothetical protein